MTLLTNYQKPEIMKYTIFALTIILLGLSFSNNVYADYIIPESIYGELDNNIIQLDFSDDITGHR